MKKLLILLTIISIVACKEKHNESIIGMQFKDYRKINQLANFKKIIDTSFYLIDFEPKYGILHLRNEKKDLVIYANIWHDTDGKRTYKVLDTLSFSNFDKNEKVTIGYCEIDLKNQRNGNLIALVENTDGKNMFINRIKEAWVANPLSEKIEPIKNIDKVDCFNEWYNGEETKINYDLLNEKQ
jgi:hypothetical protein